MSFGLVEIPAQFDPVGPRRICGFQNDGIRLGFQELFDLIEGLSAGLSHGSKSGVSDQFLLNFFVSAVGERSFCGIDAVDNEL